MRTSQLLITRVVAPLAVGGLVISGSVLAVAGSAAAASPASGASPPGAAGVTTQHWARTASVAFSKLAPAVPNAKAAAAEARAIATVHRSLSPHPAANSPDVAGSFAPPVVSPTPVISSAPGFQRSWEGINAYTEAQAELFTFTPPDQGLCAGNGYVFEIVNNAVRIYHASGSPASPTISSNSFFGLPAAYDPATNRYGPVPTDPTCTYDPATGRWFVDEVALETNPKTGGYTLVNKATLAVSTSSNPLGSYNVYSLNLTDTHAGGMHVNCPCLGDFPKIAVDSHGLFLSTNEYPWIGSGFYGNGYNGAQLYVASKRQLAAGSSSVTTVHFSNTSLMYHGRTVPGFTVWPAAVPAGQYATEDGGSEYFVSSAASVEANPTGFTGFSNLVGVYQVSNTSSLDTSNPEVRLTGKLVPSEVYGEAPLASQRPGPVPLRDCLAVTCHPGIGPSSEQEGSLDPSDTRPLTVWYANGRLSMALDSVMRVNGNLQAGPAWFVISPPADSAAPRVLTQGYIGVTGNNVIYPSVATAPSGTGVMDFTLSGRTYYPSQGYIEWTPTGPTTGISTTVPGAAPLDDFCQYNFFNCAGTSTPTARPRYGDYSWASYMNGSVYIANEDVSSNCTFAQYAKDPTCGGTRAPLSNWSTRISAITP